MVTLLLGAYGHGKSTEIINRIKTDYEKAIKISFGKCQVDKKIFLIVPEQETLIAERQICNQLPSNAQLYIETTNLTRLADSVFRKTGGLRYNYVNKSGKNLIMYRAICEIRESLTKFDIAKGKEKGSIKLFLQAIAELKTYGVGIKGLEKVCSELEKDEEYKDLSKRISDLIKIWSTYEKLLTDMYDDPLDTLSMLEKKLDEVSFFKGTNVYIDSFYGFTKSQFGIIEKIITTADNVTIALDCPFDSCANSMQYTRIETTKKRLLSLCERAKKEVECISFKDDYKHKNEEIKYVCNNIWNFSAKSILPQGNVNLALANNEFEECEYVCSKIKELILKGEKYGNIAIIARNTSTYQGIIDFCLKKYDIPHYLSAPSKVMVKPVVKMVFSALNALNGYRIEDVINYAKCGYTDIKQEDLCLLESYIYRWNIYGKKFLDEDFWNANPDGFVKNPTITQVNNLIKIKDARKILLENLSILEKPFISGLSVKDCAKAVYDFLNKHKVREKLRKEIKDEKDVSAAQELSQVWSALISSLDTIYTVCGDTKCDIETFITLFGYALMDAKIGSIPTNEDNVTIADASLVRAKNIKHVFVLGANEGDFPATVTDTSFFSDSDKIALESHSLELFKPSLEELNNIDYEIYKKTINLSAKTEERGYDELLFFKNSIACASDSITVTALYSDIQGNKKETSVGFNRIKSLLTGYEPIDISTVPTVDKIYTEQVAKELFGSANNELKAAISHLTDISEAKSNFVNEFNSVSEDVAATVFGNTLHLSKSQIEKFVNCRFNYYCSYVLDLRENSKIVFSHNDIGKLVHSIFEHFLKIENTEDKKYTKEEIYETVKKLTDSYTAQICGVRALTNKMRHFFNRIINTVCVFVESILEEKKKSNFKSEYFEVSIKGDGDSAPLPFEFSVDDGTSVVLSGIADRVDILRTEDTTYFKVFDYKTGTYEFKRSQVEKGLDMQMLIYLLALSNMKECDFKKKFMKDTDKIEPAGFVFLTYNINKTDAKTEVDLDSNEAIINEGIAIDSKISRSGLELNDENLLCDDDKFNLKKNSKIDSAEFSNIFETVKNNITKVCLDMLSGNANAAPLNGENPCRYCKNGAVCRKRVKQ